MAAILIGNRCLAPHRFKHDHAKLAELARVVGRSTARPHDAAHAILARRRVSVGLQRRARRVPVLARRKIVRSAAHRIRTRQLASRIVLQYQTTHPVTVRRQNNFHHRHECYPLLASPASAMRAGNGTGLPFGSLRSAVVLLTRSLGRRNPLHRGESRRISILSAMSRGSVLETTKPSTPLWISSRLEGDAVATTGVPAAIASSTAFEHPSSLNADTNTRKDLKWSVTS